MSLAVSVSNVSCVSVHKVKGIELILIVKIIAAALIGIALASLLLGAMAYLPANMLLGLNVVGAISSILSVILLVIIWRLHSEKAKQTI